MGKTRISIVTALAANLLLLPLLLATPDPARANGMAWPWGDCCKESTERSFFLSRTPWLLVFDHQGTLQFHAHGSALDQVDAIAASLAHSSGQPGNKTASEIGGS